MFIHQAGCLSPFEYNVIFRKLCLISRVNPLPNLITAGGQNSFSFYKMRREMLSGRDCKASVRTLNIVSLIRTSIKTGLEQTLFTIYFACSIPLSFGFAIKHINLLLCHYGTEIRQLRNILCVRKDIINIGSNLSQIKRERMLAFLQKIKDEHRDDDDMLIALGEIESELTSKKYGLVWEQHEEAVDPYLR